MTTPHRSATPWKLEVVKGKEPGRLYALEAGENVLGNALNGSPGIELADQEANSPRRMAARQAQIEPSNGTLTIRDLRSPGGTFVNRERLLPGNDRKLEAGDLIQLGSVQLRVVKGGEPVSASASNRPFLFTMKCGAVCRSWDDFLTISAQRWQDLRDEMTSGRLAGFLASVGRTDLAPDPNRPGSPDERLDAWIGSLPVSRSSSPELDVHPKSIVVRALAVGGSTRRKVQISNTGYRLLRVNARVEPPDTPWLSLVGSAQGALVTIDATELNFEVVLVEGTPIPVTAYLVLESNGGVERVEVRIEAQAAQVEQEPAPIAPSLGLRERLAPLSARQRMVGFAAAALGGRLAMMLADRVLPVTGELPGLLGASSLLAMLGAVLGIEFAWRRGEPRDVPAAGLTGAVVGLMAAAVLVAMARVVEPIGGGWAVVSLAMWAVGGLLLAGLSVWTIPPRARNAGEGP